MLVVKVKKQREFSKSGQIMCSFSFEHLKRVADGTCANPWENDGAVGGQESGDPEEVETQTICSWISFYFTWFSLSPLCRATAEKHHYQKVRGEFLFVCPSPQYGEWSCVRIG